MQLVPKAFFVGAAHKNFAVLDFSLKAFLNEKNTFLEVVATVSFLIKRYYVACILSSSGPGPGQVRVRKVRN